MPNSDQHGFPGLTLHLILMEREPLCSIYLDIELKNLCLLFLFCLISSSLSNLVWLEILGSTLLALERTHRAWSGMCRQSWSMLALPWLELLEFFSQMWVPQNRRLICLVGGILISSYFLVSPFPKLLLKVEKHLLDRAKKLTQECGKQDMILSIYIFKLNTDHSIAIWLLSRDKRDRDSGNRCDISLFIFYFKSIEIYCIIVYANRSMSTSFIYTSLLLTTSYRCCSYYEWQGSENCQFGMKQVLWNSNLQAQGRWLWSSCSWWGKKVFNR